MIDQEATSVSVILPFYNRGKTLSRAIESVLQQTRPVKELILIDDGSTDNSAQIAHSYTQQYDHIKFVSQPNQGAAAARNLGLTMAAGQWIAFLDSDDEWLPIKNEICSNISIKQPNTEFIHTSYVTIRDGKTNLRLNNNVNLRENKIKLLSMFGIKTSTVVVSRSLLNKTGFFRTDLKTCEDYELFWRLVACSKKVGYSTENLVRIEESQNSLTVITSSLSRKADDFIAITSALKWIKERNYERNLIDAIEEHQYWTFVDLLSTIIQKRKIIDLIRFYLIFNREQNFSKAMRGLISAISGKT